MIIRGKSISSVEEIPERNVSEMIRQNRFERRLDMKKVINIYNNSGKKASLIVSNEPINQFFSLEIDKKGNIAFQNSNNYNFQQIIIENGKFYSLKQDVQDNTVIYYTTFLYFEEHQKWKVYCKNNMMDSIFLNSLASNICLLERGLENCVDIEFNIV